MKTLIHIGAPKTATTYLQEAYYPFHPELAYVPHVNEWNRWMWGLDNANIKAIATCEEGIIGQPIMRTAILTNLERLVKNPLILITTRAPDASLIASIYSQSIRGGNRRSFHSYYSQNLAYWTKVFDYKSAYDECCFIFGSENVLLLPQELLRANSRQFFDILESRLGISPFQPIESNQLNQKLSVEQIAFYRLFWPLLSGIVRLRGNRKLPLYAKKIFMTHSPIMNEISRKLGWFSQLIIKQLDKRRAKQIDMSNDSILESFSCYVPMMEQLPYYADFLRIYKNGK